MNETVHKELHPITSLKNDLTPNLQFFLFLYNLLARITLLDD